MVVGSGVGPGVGDWVGFLVLGDGVGGAAVGTGDFVGGGVGAIVGGGVGALVRSNGSPAVFRESEVVPVGPTGIVRGLLVAVLID